MEKLSEIFHSKISIKEMAFGNEKKYVISGPCTLTDKPNLNNRVYPKDLMNKAIEKMQPKVEARKVKMALDHPDWQAKLADCAALMTKLTPVQEDGFAYYEAQIIDTAKGKDLKALVDAGAMVGVSTRGYGECLHDQEIPGYPGKFSVLQNYEMESVDFVDGPSVKETEDLMKIEQKKQQENKMKTLAELRKEFPDAFVDFDKQIESDKKALTDLVEAGKVQITKLTKEFNTIVDSIKGVKPELFSTTTVPETDIIKAKEAEITTLKTSINEHVEKINKFDIQIKQIESEKTKIARDAAIEKIKADDADFFKIESMVKKFENCINAEEIKQVYESNKEMITDLKKSLGGKVEDSKTKTDKTPESKKLTEAQVNDMNYRNNQRRSSGMSAMTVEQYAEKFAK